MITENEGICAGELPLRLLLQNIAAELHALQRDGRNLENAIGHSILGGSPSAGETLTSLQGIDLIVQTLGELGGYIDQLAMMTNDGDAIDVRAPLAKLSLRGLAENLSRVRRDDPLKIVRDAGGDVDLF